jgi:hypothetical protein
MGWRGYCQNAPALVGGRMDAQTATAVGGEQ